MDQIKRFTLSLALACCAQFSNAWLSNYFDVSKDSDSMIMIEAVLKLMLCNDTINVRAWEESVRSRTMDAQKCEEAAELEKCVYNAYQDTVAEYIKHLVSDARELCRDLVCKKPELQTILLLSLAICLSIIIIAVVSFYIVRKRKVKCIHLVVRACEEYTPCEDCNFEE